MSEWKPIATAPKDGTRVVLAEWSEYDDAWQFGESYWRKYNETYGGEGFGWIGHTPTHWTFPPPKGDTP